MCDRTNPPSPRPGCWGAGSSPSRAGPRLRTRTPRGHILGRAGKAVHWVKRLGVGARPGGSRRSTGRRSKPGPIESRPALEEVPGSSGRTVLTQFLIRGMTGLAIYPLLEERLLSGVPLWEHPTPGRV